MKLVLWQKVLVHLENVERSGIVDDEAWPPELTQVAMAAALGKSRGMISLALTSLVGSGYVTSQMHRVKGSGRMVMCYRLTKEGRKQAKRIMAMVAAEGEDLGEIMQRTFNEPKTLSDIEADLHVLRERLVAANNRLERLENALRELEAGA